jgi:hypothetical protein
MAYYSPAYEMRDPLEGELRLLRRTSIKADQFLLEKELERRNAKRSSSSSSSNQEATTLHQAFKKLRLDEHDTVQQAYSTPRSPAYSPASPAYSPTSLAYSPTTEAFAADADQM